MIDPLKRVCGHDSKGKIGRVRIVGMKYEEMYKLLEVTRPVEGEVQK